LTQAQCDALAPLMNQSLEKHFSKNEFNQACLDALEGVGLPAVFPTSDEVVDEEAKRYS
jgi:hypothetical protein